MPAQEDAAGREVWTEFRLAVKRRFFIRCLHLFPGAAKKLKAAAGPKGLSEAYIWNEVLETDQFARNIGQDMGGQDAALEMLGGMAGKIQLNTMFDELVKMFDAIKPKIAAFS